MLHKKTRHRCFLSVSPPQNGGGSTSTEGFERRRDQTAAEAVGGDCRRAEPSQSYRAADDSGDVIAVPSADVPDIHVGSFRRTLSL